MLKLFMFFFFVIALNVNPLFSKSNALNIDISAALNSKKTLGFRNNLRSPIKSNINYNLQYNKKKFSSQLALNFDKNNTITFDNSYINYQKGISIFNIGMIDRNWSFSEKSSLILSSNARPLKAISAKIENKIDWLSSNANWSIEAINASTNDTYLDKDSMLFGVRAIISPAEQLSFELLQTSQWGGVDNKINSSKFGALLFGNSNDGPNNKINKMAGFGVSYTLPIKENIYRVYGQIIGEDEAGNLPSCHSTMTGIELSAPKIKLPTIITLEIIDTRVKLSSNGFCGANTMYNNGNYDYTNYGTVLGVPIDTEGVSIELFGQSQISNNLSINYSASLITINDKNFSDHRLSSKRNTGNLISLGISWKKNKFKLNGNVGYQNINLDKSNITKGAMFNLFSSINF